VNVVGYIRVSSKGQMEGDGPARQVDAIKTFCASHKLNIIWSYTEEGVSGTVEAMDREVFSEMICYIERCKDSGKPVEAVVVERLDRLARDLMVSEILLKELRTRGIKVFAADQGALIDMANNEGDPTRKLIRQIIGALAEWEKSQLVLKLRLARERKKRQGFRMCGNIPYGKTVNERTILGLMKLWRSQGFSFERISALLNESDFKTRGEVGKWNRARVCSVYNFHINHQKKEKAKPCKVPTINI